MVVGLRQAQGPEPAAPAGERVDALDRVACRPRASAAEPAPEARVTPVEHGAKAVAAVRAGADELDQLTGIVADWLENLDAHRPIIPPSSLPAQRRESLVGASKELVLTDTRLPSGGGRPGGSAGR